MNATIHPILPLQPVANSGWFFASDMDGTLFSNVYASSDEVSLVHQKIGRHLDTTNTPSAYVTARRIGLVDEAITQHGLFTPTMVAADVGTSIYIRDKNRWKFSEEWAERLASSWDTKALREIERVIFQLPGGRLQPGSNQNRFKRCYFCDPAGATASAVREMLLPKIGQIADVTVLVSAQAHNECFYIDVLPPNGSKVDAIRFMAAMVGIGHDRIFYSGDSGNDRDALLFAGMAVLVGACEKGFADSIVKERPNLFSSALPHIFGVADGLRHFGLLNR